MSASQELEGAKECKILDRFGPLRA
jgi:hypothetical protein